MTIDERLDALMSKLPFTNNGTDYRIRSELKSALLEVACDQREACGEALLNLDDSANFKVDRDRARQAVLAAEIK